MVDYHELVDKQLLNLMNPAQSAEGRAGVIIAQGMDSALDIVDDQLEPQLADLVQHDEGEFGRGVLGAGTL
jgi:hypothetical protein